MGRILVVDDDPDVVEAVGAVLRGEGHVVAEAHTRPEGMEQVASFSPDLIVLDVMMEFQDDGLAMAQDLRRLGYSNPILMLTNVSKATGLHFDKNSDTVPVSAFQEKPIAPTALVKKVRALLAGKED